VPEGLRLFGDDAAQLAGDIVVKALQSFWDRSYPRWDPDLGRGLNAYFMTYCLMKLPDAYQSWFRREVQPTTNAISLDDIAELCGKAKFEDQIELLELIRLVAGRDPRTLRILVLRRDGHSISDICRLLREDGVLMTKRGISTLLRELRQRLQDEETAG